MSSNYQHSSWLLGQFFFWEFATISSFPAFIYFLYKKKHHGLFWNNNFVEGPFDSNKEWERVRERYRTQQHLFIIFSSFNSPFFFVHNNWLFFLLSVLVQQSLFLTIFLLDLFKRERWCKFDQLDKATFLILLFLKSIWSVIKIHQPKFMSGHRLENDPYFFKRSVRLLHYYMWYYKVDQHISKYRP